MKKHPDLCVRDMKKSHYFVLHRSVEGLEKCEVFSVQAHYGDASSS